MKIVIIIKNTKLIIGITFFNTFPRASIIRLASTKIEETKIVGIIKGETTETK